MAVVMAGVDVAGADADLVAASVPVISTVSTASSPTARACGSGGAGRRRSRLPSGLHRHWPGTARRAALTRRWVFPSLLRKT